MTLILRIKGKINNPNAPKLIKYDPIENSIGSLFLWDAGRQPFSVTPANGTVLPNLLDDFDNATGKAFEVTKGTASVNNDYAKIELTQKKALHFIVSQTYPTDIPGEAFWGVLGDSALMAHIYDQIVNNPNLYISFWIQGTRKGKDRSGKFGPMLSYVRDNNSNSVFYMTSKESKPAVSANSTSVSKLQNVAGTVDAFLSPNAHQMNVRGYSFQPVYPDSRFFLGSGIFGPWSTELALNESPSFALYRIYIEDLKLSGRTFAEVKAIDDAEFEKAFNVGGRFYGDTWSDPATILP